jgi:hypothetical protein
MSEENTNDGGMQLANDYSSVYANNSHFEASVWDLKIIFGELEQHTGKSLVDWHTAVTMPWAQAKVLVYYLRTNITFHESTQQAIHVPTAVVPTKPEPPPEQLDTPVTRAFYEAALKIHEEMFP